jgi:hypothetical protein
MARARVCVGGGQGVLGSLGGVGWVGREFRHGSHVSLCVNI